MSFMTFGGILEADRRTRSYENRTRILRRRAADDAVWKRWEGLVKEETRLEKEKDKSRSSRKEGD